MYATLRDLASQGPLLEAAQSRGCLPGSLETLQLDVRDADSIAAAQARVTEGRVDVLGEPPGKTSPRAFFTLCPNQDVPKPTEHWGDGREGGPCVRRQGRVSLPAVCNAGRGLVGPLEAHKEGSVDAVLDVNLTGTVRMLQAFLPDMKRRRSGRILVTGSIGGLMGERNAAKGQRRAGRGWLSKSDGEEGVQ